MTTKTSNNNNINNMTTFCVDLLHKKRALRGGSNLRNRPFEQFRSYLTTMIYHRRPPRVFFFVFVPPIYYLRSSCSSYLPLRNLDPGSHSRPYSSLPATVRAYIFYREKGSTLSSLVDSHRIVPTHAMIRFLQSIWCTRKSPWGDSNSRRRPLSILKLPNTPPGPRCQRTLNILYYYYYYYYYYCLQSVLLLHYQ